MTHKVSSTQESYAVHRGSRGRIGLLAEVRHRLDLQEGDRLILTVKADGSLRLISALSPAGGGAG